MSPATAAVAGLYAVADTGLLSPDALQAAVTRAIAGGARLIQYRDKGHDAPRRRAQAESLGRLCAAAGVPLIINDDVQLALDVGAAGVHLGRNDAPPDGARRRLGRDAVIGVSCYNSLESALQAEAQGADYVAFGAFYPSPTKPGAVRADAALLARARAQLHCPIVAIGGITPDNAAPLIAAGAAAVAVIHAVFGDPDPAAAARRFAVLFHRPRRGDGRPANPQQAKD